MRYNHGKYIQNLHNCTSSSIWSIKIKVNFYLTGFSNLPNPVLLVKKGWSWEIRILVFLVYDIDFVIITIEHP